MREAIAIALSAIVLIFSQILVAEEFEPGSEKGKTVTEVEKDGVKTTTIREGNIQPYPEREVGKISTSEVSQIKMRREVHSFWALGFGPAWIPAYSEHLYSGTLGIHWDVHEHAEINLNLSGGGSRQTGFGTLELGSNYFFLPGDITPYVGASFGGGYTSGTGSGFSGGTGFGVRFFRTSSVNLDLGFTYHVIFGQGSISPVIGSQVMVLF